MGRIAAIGAGIAVQGFGLAGALVFPAETADEIRAAWRALPVDVDVVLLTPGAADAIAPVTRPLVAVIPP